MQAVIRPGVQQCARARRKFRGAGKNDAHDNSIQRRFGFGCEPGEEQAASAQARAASRWRLIILLLTRICFNCDR
jgi:hypothetical protein